MLLYDKEFLKQLDQQKHKVIYARITALNFNEHPLEYIEGRVTQGSINVDGSSACRRSCSLTIAAPGFQYNNFYWGLNTKFKLEIGIENYINDLYPNIIWFNQGIYIITSFNTSQNTSTLNITIQGKDKMCLLDGSIGGSLESSIDFGTIEEENALGLWEIRKIPIPEIIKNLIHVYGKEPYHNIIIKDLDTYGLELLEYRYDVPLFLYRSAENENPIYDNVILKGDTAKVTVYNSKGEIVTHPSGIPGVADLRLNDILLSEVPIQYFENLTETFTGDSELYQFTFKNNGIKKFYVTKINQGDTAGYRKTDLIYPDDLIANVGESITSVLDKIKNMLSEFEYFYNTYGQFVFQKKQSFKEAIWKFDEEGENQNTNESFFMAELEYAYKFYNNELIASFNNNPNLTQIKNDYSIWGEREGISGIKIPIHLRYAIDKKPLQYTRITVDTNDLEAINNYNQKYGTHINMQDALTFKKSDIYGEVKTTIFCDWREIIYQMALDYYKYNFLDDFELKVAAANPIDYPTGRTGYEQYYIDMNSFWRELYYPKYHEEFYDADKQTIIKYSSLESDINALDLEIYGEKPSEDSIFENRTGGIENDLVELNRAPYEADTEGNYHKASLITDWWKTEKYKFYYLPEGAEKSSCVTDEDLYLSMLKEFYFKKKEELENLQEQLEYQQLKYKDFQYTDYYEKEEEHAWWNRKVYETPEQINFWFDFLDASGELEQFSVPVVGSRPKAINDTTIKSIYFRETPAVVYLENLDDMKNYEAGFRFIQAPDAKNMFHISAQGKNTKDKLSELLYKHGYCVDSATITTIPIYYLEPNTRIYIQDEKTGLQGDYIASKFTIPLAYNGTMSITATKAAENIL